MDSHLRSSLPLPCGTADIDSNAVGAFGDEQGNRTGSGKGESMESKLKQLPNIMSVEVQRRATAILHSSDFFYRLPL